MGLTGNEGSGFTPNNNSPPPVGNSIYINPDSSQDKGKSNTSLSVYELSDEQRKNWEPRRRNYWVEGELRHGRYRTLSDSTLPKYPEERPDHLLDKYELRDARGWWRNSCIANLFRESPLEFPWDDLPSPNDPFFSYRLAFNSPETESILEESSEPVWPGSPLDKDFETKILRKGTVDYDFREYKEIWKPKRNVGYEGTEFQLEWTIILELERLKI